MTEEMSMYFIATGVCFSLYLVVMRILRQRRVSNYEDVHYPADITERIEIAKAYTVADVAWKKYRQRTGDTTDPINLIGTPEKDAIQALWKVYFDLYVVWLKRNPAPDGYVWGMTQFGPILMCSDSRHPAGWALP